MNEKLQQTIKEEMPKLPKELQDAIGSLDWVKITQELALKYQLTEEQLTDFQTETLLVLIGTEGLEYYANNIESEASIEEEVAKNVARESDEKIFRPIYKILTDIVKSKLKSKKPNWKQSLEFILSGGDYSVFMEDTREEERPGSRKL